jgi:hypothetical protein
MQRPSQHGYSQGWECFYTRNFLNLLNWQRYDISWWRRNVPHTLNYFIARIHRAKSSQIHTWYILYSAWEKLHGINHDRRHYSHTWYSVYQNICNSCRAFVFHHIIGNNVISLKPYFYAWTPPTHYRQCPHNSEGHCASFMLKSI